MFAVNAGSCRCHGLENGCYFVIYYHYYYIFFTKIKNQNIIKKLYIPIVLDQGWATAGGPPSLFVRARTCLSTFLSSKIVLQFTSSNSKSSRINNCILENFSIIIKHNIYILNLDIYSSYHGRKIYINELFSFNNERYNFIPGPQSS